jgi:hypothetical protein
MSDDRVLARSTWEAILSNGLRLAVVPFSCVIRSYSATWSGRAAGGMACERCVTPYHATRRRRSKQRLVANLLTK